VDHLAGKRRSGHHGRVIEIRHATAQDLPGLYRVGLLTGDAGRDGSALFANPDLIGHVYVGPYAVGEPAHAFAAVDADGVAGYCLAARDTRAFEAWCESSWWPALRAQYPRRPGGSPDAAIIELFHAPEVAPDEIAGPFPAHLHIDLLERVRGTGLGRRMIERQLAGLAAAGASACHLVAASSNENAIAFYEHLGWRILRREPEDCFLGIELR
jgi:ribosomal protein S18 acetylase RimI-like enzyme